MSDIDFLANVTSYDQDVDIQSALEIKQIIVFNSRLRVIWKMTIMISLLGQSHCRHVIISIKTKTVVQHTNRDTDTLAPRGHSRP